MKPLSLIVGIMIIGIALISLYFAVVCVYKDGYNKGRHDGMGEMYQKFLSQPVIDRGCPEA